jgi:enamine deaminase RidA (YjgF/YER057c/UK114 family)
MKEFDDMAARRSISAPDIPEHTNPIPAATIVGNMLFTSAIGGEDPQSHALPGEKETEIANVFTTIQAIMREAGGTVENIGKVSVFLADKEDRKLVNSHWLSMFPDENSRPVRHTVAQQLPSGRCIQVELIAVLS